MSIEKGPDHDIPPISMPEREKTIEQRRQEEENRIKDIELRVDEWARQFFAILKNHFLKTEKITPDLEALEQDKIDQLLQNFPRELVRTKHDLKYFLSRALKSFGKADTDFEVLESGESMCYQENINMLYSLVAKILGYTKEDIEKITYTRPTFYREDRDALQDIQITEEVRKKLPPKFFQNPTKFIEALNLVEREEEEFGHDIDDLASTPYDFTRVKRYKKLVFKRVDLSKVNFGTEEINEAQKITGLLSELGDSRIRVQNFVGFIYDQGNIYLVSELIKGKSCYDLIVEQSLNAQNYFQWTGKNYFENSEGLKIGNQISEFLKQHHMDIEDRNIIIELKKGKEFKDPDSVKEITIIDFETKK